MLSKKILINNVILRELKRDFLEYGAASIPFQLIFYF